jgi:hypothetical protein
MEQVAAWQSCAGRLHKTRADALEDDLIDLLQKAWGAMPDCRDRGDPVIIGRILAQHIRPRKALLDALLYFEEHSGKS